MGLSCPVRFETRFTLEKTSGRRCRNPTKPRAECQPVSKIYMSKKKEIIIILSGMPGPARACALGFRGSIESQVSGHWTQLN